MSQKTKIIGVKHSGASVYLGTDKFGNPMWTRDPNRIMQYLCDGWRYRFNQFRALRPGRGVKVTDPESGEEKWENIPLGGVDATSVPNDTETKAECSWLVSMPSRIFQHPKKEEATSWFAALKRIKTSGGKAPGFRSFKRDDQIFGCWHVNGENAKFTNLNNSRGHVIISGQMPARVKKPGEKSPKWNICIKLSVHDTIREYTSVKVNWTKKTLVFVNAPVALDRTPTGAITGIDRGVAHTLTTSDGEFFDMPKEKLTSLQRYVRLQKKLSRRDRVNGPKTTSSNRKRSLQEMNSIAKKESNRRETWMHQTSAEMVKRYDYIAIEDLRVKNMTAKGKHKRGLNRAILKNNWGQFKEFLTYKTSLAGVKLAIVDPAYTSQTCNNCGHIARENRESQSVFKCVECGHIDNADVNAAKNILAKATAN